MKKIHNFFKQKLAGGSATASGVSGVIGSLPNVCHFICMSIVSVFSALGITLNILPLMFLQTYQMYFWVAAFVLTTLSFYFYLSQNRKITWERNLLLINAGLLIFGIPFAALSDFMDFFRFIGASMAIAGVFLLLLGKKLQSIFLDSKNISYEYEPPKSEARGNAVNAWEMPQLNLSKLLFALVIGGFIVNQYLMYRMDVFASLLPQIEMPGRNNLMTSQSKMKLTAFDIALAKERMDKNNDGICDTCGMPMQQCIDSGQMDCNMGGNPQAIGVLGTAHDHADFKVFVDGQAINFAKDKNYMKSSFIHLDNQVNKDDASGVLHMHAKKVPLWLFFRSLGMNLSKDSLTLSDGRVLKNDNNNTLKFYLNGQKVDELGEYSYQPLDKLLISYGPENDPDLQNQINSVTNYAKDHQK